MFLWYNFYIRAGVKCRYLCSVPKLSVIVGGSTNPCLLLPSQRLLATERAAHTASDLSAKYQCATVTMRMISARLFSFVPNLSVVVGGSTNPCLPLPAQRLLATERAAHTMGDLRASGLLAVHTYQGFWYLFVSGFWLH